MRSLKEKIAECIANCNCDAAITKRHYAWAATIMDIYNPILADKDAQIKLLMDTMQECCNDITKAMEGK